MIDSEKKAFTLTEVSAITGVNEDVLLVYVEREWISPETRNQPVFFDREDVARVRLIRDLIVDLAVNDEAVPVVLHLLDQVYFLRDRIRKLGSHEQS